MSISMDKSMMKSTDSDATLLDLSQSTLNFILDEQQQAIADGGPSVAGATGSHSASVSDHRDVDATLIAPNTGPSTNKDKHNSISIIDISDTSLGDEIITISSSSEGIILILLIFFIFVNCVLLAVFVLLYRVLRYLGKKNKFISKYKVRAKESTKFVFAQVLLNSILVCLKFVNSLECLQYSANFLKRLL